MMNGMYTNQDDEEEVQELYGGAMSSCYKTLLEIWNTSSLLIPQRDVEVLQTLSSGAL